VKCQRCRTEYNGHSGATLTQIAIVYAIATVFLLLAAGLCLAWLLV